jgi:hypothetical protein
MAKTTTKVRKTQSMTKLYVISTRKICSGEAPTSEDRISRTEAIGKSRAVCNSGFSILVVITLDRNFGKFTMRNIKPMKELRKRPFHGRGFSISSSNRI